MENRSINNAFIITSLFDSQKKLETIFYSFLSFGFLPVFSPASWFLVVQDLFTRFYAQTGTTRIGLGLHYSALLAVIMAVSSFYGLNFLNRKFGREIFKIIPIVLIFISIFLYRFILHGPFALAYNPAFYNHTKDFSFLNKLVQSVPKNSTVMTQNNLAPHFIHSQTKVYLLTLDYLQKNPDYVVMDLREGQNPNDFFEIGPDKARKLLNFLLNDRCYENIYPSQSQYIFKRICK